MKLVPQQARQSGQSLAEYGLIIALIGVFSLVSLSLLGDSVSNSLNGLASTVSGTQASGNPPGNEPPPAAPPVVGGGCACITAQGQNL